MPLFSCDTSAGARSLNSAREMTQNAVVLSRNTSAGSRSLDNVVNHNAVVLSRETSADSGRLDGGVEESLAHKFTCVFRPASQTGKRTGWSSKPSVVKTQSGSDLQERLHGLHPATAHALKARWWKVLSFHLWPRALANSEKGRLPSNSPSLESWSTAKYGSPSQKHWIITRNI